MKNLLKFLITILSITYTAAIDCNQPLVYNDECYFYNEKKFLKVSCDLESAKRLKVTSDGKFCYQRKQDKMVCLTQITKKQTKIRMMHTNLQKNAEESELVIFSLENNQLKVTKPD